MCLTTRSRGLLANCPPVEVPRLKVPAVVPRQRVDHCPVVCVPGTGGETRQTSGSSEHKAKKRRNTDLPQQPMELSASPEDGKRTLRSQVCTIARESLRPMCVVQKSGHDAGAMVEPLSEDEPISTG